MSDSDPDVSEVDPTSEDASDDEERPSLRTRRELSNTRRANRTRNTSKAYRSKMRKYEKVCKELGLPSSPVEPKVATQVLMHLERQHSSGEEIIGISTVKQIGAALNDAYKEQCLCSGSEGSFDLKDDKFYKQALENLRDSVMKGGRKEDVDPQAHTAVDIYSVEEWNRMHLIMFGMCSLTFAMLQCMMLVMHYGVGRSDDVRQFRIADLAKPAALTARPCIGFVYSLVLRGGKKDQGGRAQHVGYVRNKDPHLCPVRSMGLYLFYKYTNGSCEFPSPTNRAQWLAAVLFTLKDPNKVVSYNWLNVNITQVFQLAGIAIAKKCHAMRHAGAQFMDQKGVSADDIRRYGRWEHEAMCASYLVDLPPKGLMSHANFPLEQLGMEQAYYHPRFLIGVSDSLIHEVFPWLPQLGKDAQMVGNTLPSAQAVFEHVKLLGLALVQDTAHFCALSPQLVKDCPLAKKLRRSIEFKNIITTYTQSHQSRVFEHLRPKSASEKMDSMLQAVQGLQAMQGFLHGASISLAPTPAPLAPTPAPLAAQGASTSVPPPIPAPLPTHMPSAMQQAFGGLPGLGNLMALGTGQASMGMGMGQQGGWGTGSMGMGNMGMGMGQQSGLGMGSMGSHPHVQQTKAIKTGQDSTTQFLVDIKTTTKAWQAWTDGVNGQPPIRKMEEEGLGWREGSENLRKRMDEFKLVIYFILARSKRLRISPSAAANDLQHNVLNVNRIKSLRGLREWAPINAKEDWDAGKQLKSQAASKGVQPTQMPTPSPLKKLRARGVGHSTPSKARGVAAQTPAQPAPPPPPGGPASTSGGVSSALPAAQTPAQPAPPPPPGITGAQDLVNIILKRALQTRVPPKQALEELMKHISQPQLEDMYKELTKAEPHQSSKGPTSGYCEFCSFYRKSAKDVESRQVTAQAGAAWGKLQEEQKCVYEVYAYIINVVEKRVRKKGKGEERADSEKKKKKKKKA